MKQALKWMGLILAGLLLLLVVGVVGVSAAGTARLNRSLDIEAERVAIPTDEAALARGEHLVDVLCRSCHGADLAGQPFFDEPPIGTIYAANLTGLADTHRPGDLVLAIRHGLDNDGRQLMIMPAESFVHLSEADLGAIIAYLRTVPRTGEVWPEPQLQPVGRIMVGAGLFDAMFPAAYIDHDQPFPAMPAVGANMAYGQYLSRLCQSCHGPDLAGGQPPDPESLPAPNLTPGGELAGWTEADFMAAMRTGLTPGGRLLDPAYMPWNSVGKLDDEELRALWMYLESLPARPTASE